MLLVKGNIQNSAKEEVKREPIPEGIYPAAVVGIYDLGTQYNPIYDNSSWQILFVFDLMNGDEHRLASRRFTASLHPKASLTRVVESLLNRNLTQSELARGIDLKQFVNPDNPTYGQIYLKQITSNGAVHNVVDSILPATKSMVRFAPAGEMQYFSLKEGLATLPEKTPSWIRNIIEKSQEVQDIEAIKRGETPVHPKKIVKPQNVNLAPMSEKQSNYLFKLLTPEQKAEVEETFEIKAEDLNSTAARVLIDYMKNVTKGAATFSIEDVCALVPSPVAASKDAVAKDAVKGKDKNFSGPAR
jgi:hypothetical protein